MKIQNKIVFLRGKKTILRPISESDIPFFIKWINDPEVAKFIARHWPLMELTEKKWLEKKAESDDSIVLVIETLEGKPIGIMGIDKIDWVNRTAITGALIGEKAYWGKGFGTDAKMQLLNYAFNTLGLRKICSEVISFNGRSVAYSKKCGYIEEGRKRQQIFREGKCWDMVLLGVFKEEWLPKWQAYNKNLTKKLRK